MTPTRFLTAAGVVLTTIGTLGVTHRLGRISRARFFRRFHQHARENAAAGFVQPWSVWSAAHP